MSNIVNPPPPVDLGDENPLRRVHFRLWQIAVSVITVVLCGWCFTWGVFPGIASVFLAKHVLVAVLAAGLHYPATQQRQSRVSDGIGQKDVDETGETR